VKIDVPAGTSPAFTNSVTERIEAQLAGIPGIGDAESRVATVGTSSQWGGIFGGSGDGTVTVSFVDYERASTTSSRPWRDAGAARRGHRRRGLQGREAQQRAGQRQARQPRDHRRRPGRAAAARDPGDRVLREAPVYARLEGWRATWRTAGRSWWSRWTARRRRSYGLSTSQVGNTVRTAIMGAEAAKFRTGNDEYDIIVRLAEPYRQDLERAGGPDGDGTRGGRSRSTPWRAGTWTRATAASSARTWTAWPPSAPT
jgi:multidrug efflux pump subunit AcrB